MSPAFNRGEPRPASQSESSPSEATGEPQIGSRMLDQILALTAGGTPTVGFVESADVRALRGVAKSLAGEPFSLKPVAIELIHAVLKVQFEKAQLPPTTVRSMAEFIATTLHDDPPSRERLQALWAQLTEK